jgi:hypothetical protein
MMGVCEECKVMDGSSCEGCFKLKEENERLARAFTAGFEAAKKKAISLLQTAFDSNWNVEDTLTELSNIKEE